MSETPTISSIYLVRKPQRSLSNPFLDPPSWHTSHWDINTKCSGYLPWGKTASNMASETTTISSIYKVMNLHCPPSTLLLDPPSWHTSNDDINMKMSGYLPCILPRSSINCVVIGLKAHPTALCRSYNEGHVAPRYSSTLNYLHLCFINLQHCFVEKVYILKALEKLSNNLKGKIV